MWTVRMVHVSLLGVVRSPSQDADGTHEVGILRFHNEGNHIATRITGSKAMPCLLVRIDRE
jgi:hypothetical protein